MPDKSKAGKRKTKVKKNTLNPIFEETLSFVQPLASLSSRTLWLSAWHADMFGRNDFLGEVTLPLADVVFDDPAPMWYKLHERVRNIVFEKIICNVAIQKLSPKNLKKITLYQKKFELAFDGRPV